MRLLRRCLAYFRPDLPRIVWSLVLTFLATLCGLLQPVTFKVLFDSVFNGKPPSGWVDRTMLAVLPDDKVGQIIGLAGICFAITLAAAVLVMFQTMAAVKVGYYGLRHVRSDLFLHLQRLSLAYHRARPQGDPLYRMTNDAFGFQTILNIVVGNVLVSVITLVVMAWIMFSIQPLLTLVSLVAIPLLIAVHKWSQRAILTGWVSAKAADTGLTTIIQRSIASLWLTQAFGRERDEYQKFRGAVDDTMRVMFRVHWREVVYAMLVATILGLGVAVILGLGGYLVYRDEFDLHAAAGMTTGKLILFLMYLGKFYDPLNKITGSGSTFGQAVVQAKRVFEVLDEEPAIKDPPDPTPLPKRPRTIELRGVSFEYLPGRPVLRDVSTTIEPGKMVAFVGESGVGKSTILTLLPRFYDVTSGAILLDGIDVRHVRTSELRQHIAIVLQENPLLPTTVAENIAYGAPHATPQQIQAAAEAAEADAFIERLPDGYDTVLSENATNISGGQRQRLAIARALITEAPILLLDEPTSALDPQNEQLITGTLNKLKGKRTMIVVSHRLSTVADADEIFVMHDGRVVERGKHEQLIAQGGVYYRMAKHQLKLEDPGGLQLGTESTAPAVLEAPTPLSPVLRGEAG
jgi:ATP-binding cassette, subfamily B, bacterial